MNLFSHVTSVHTWKIFYCLTLVAGITLICLALFYFSDSRFQNIAAGIGSGLVIAGIQLTFNWLEHNQIEDLKRLRIKRVIPYRDDQHFYKNALNVAKKDISLLANTSERFLQDFADVARPDKQALLEALKRGVNVRILLPSVENQANENRERARNSIVRMTELHRLYEGRFDFRQFEEQAAHSILRVDSICLVGPIFPGRNKSRDLPAIMTDIDSEVGRPYMDYFERLWNSAHQ